MQPRLMRSRTEVIIAGVCGGIGEYFNVDPVIVRLIFLLVGFTTGIGLLAYPLLWLIMPKAQSLPAQPGAGQPTQGRYDAALGMQAEAEDQALREVLRQPTMVGQARPAAPPPFRYDPVTGEPLPPQPASTGDTTQLSGDPTLPPLYEPLAGVAPGAGPRSRRRWPVLGIILVGIGLMGMSSAFGIPASIVFPLLLIVLGVALLRRR